MIRLVFAEIFKIRTTRMYIGLLLAATALVALVTGLQFAMGGESSMTIEGAADVVETPADLRSILDVSSVATLFTLVLGATAVAGEYRHRTIASTFLVTPARWKVVVAKTIGFILAGALFGVVVEAVALVVSVGWLAVTGGAIPFGASVVEGLLLVPLATGLAAGFGVGIGASIPNQLAAVLAAFGWVMVVEQLVNGLLPDLALWLPFTGANTAITGLHPDLGVAGGVALFLIYTAAVVLAGIQVTRTRDIT